MLRRSGLVTLPLLIASGIFAAADADTQDVSFDKALQIPEAVLQPASTKFVWKIIWQPCLCAHY